MVLFCLVSFATCWYVNIAQKTELMQPHLDHPQMTNNHNRYLSVINVVYIKTTWNRCIILKIFHLKIFKDVGGGGGALAS